MPHRPPNDARWFDEATKTFYDEFHIALTAEEVGHSPGPGGHPMGEAGAAERTQGEAGQGRARGGMSRGGPRLRRYGPSAVQ